MSEMESTLDSLGIKIVGVRGSEIQANCPAHLERTGHEDSNPSWYINADSGAHLCFSCGFKGNLYSLIAYVKGVPIDQATDWANTSLDLVTRMTKLLGPESLPEQADLLTITESMLSAYTAVPDEFLLSRGLSREAARTYGIKYDFSKNCWIIPVRDAYGQLLGWQEKGVTGRYFNNCPKGIKKGKALFGFNQYKHGDMIVVESPLDVVRMASVGIAGGVATFGCGITVDQLNTIRGADRVIFALDNDEAGRAASRDILARCREVKAEAWFFDYSGTDAKDVGAMSRSEIMVGLENAHHMIKGEILFK